MNKDDFSLLEKYNEKVFALHIHDNNSLKDQHILPYSDGCTVNWRHFTEKINATSFSGSLMLEACYPIDYERLDAEDDGELSAPLYPMEQWLSEAKASCLRIYNEMN